MAFHNVYRWVPDPLVIGVSSSSIKPSIKCN
jgi:hypothetical protein